MPKVFIDRQICSWKNLVVGKQLQLSSAEPLLQHVHAMNEMSTQRNFIPKGVHLSKHTCPFW